MRKPSSSDDIVETAALASPTARATRPIRSPFSGVGPAVVVSLCWGVACLVWIALGDRLPGGRWLAVHLFTLGVLTNSVLAFTEHFGHTLTRTPDERRTLPLVLTNVGVLIVVIAIPVGADAVSGLGATIVTGSVLWSYVRLRAARRKSVGARFTWVVRMYERAHGQFVHGAVLGLLLGVGVLPGSWWFPARVAHLHVNVLGWGGLTLLATLVFFGPTIVRTRMVVGADDVAARALRRGATGLTVGTLLLVATGVGGVAGDLLRVVAAVGLAVFAWSVGATCRPVAVAARGAKPGPSRWPLVAVCRWFPIAAWADVVVVGTGTWKFLDAVGMAMVLGVLVQSILAVLGFVAPMLLHATQDDRQRLLASLGRGSTVRALAFNLGVAGIVFGAATRSGPGAISTTVGWALLIATVAQTLAVIGWSRIRPATPTDELATPAPA